MRIGLRHRRRGAIDRILIPKRAEIARMLAGPPLLPKRHPPLSLAPATWLSRPAGAPQQILAAIFGRSPPGGALLAGASFPERALAAARAGASAIAVATDGPFLGGSFGALARVRAALDETLGDARPPLVAWDYVLAPIQLDRALDAGADAVLLVARVIDPEALSPLLAGAVERGLTPIVEVGSEDELDTAVESGARILGVTGRDLNTLRVDASRAPSLLARIPPSVIALDLTAEDALPEAAAALSGVSYVAPEPPGI